LTKRLHHEHPLRSLSNECNDQRQISHGCGSRHGQAGVEGGVMIYIDSNGNVEIKPYLNEHPVFIEKTEWGGMRKMRYRRDILDIPFFIAEDSDAETIKQAMKDICNQAIMEIVKHLPKCLEALRKAGLVEGE
jgi:hypothetical protein